MQQFYFFEKQIHYKEYQYILSLFEDILCMP